MKRQLNILVFAYVFPPDAGSGTYRTLYFSNNWARHGDKVTVITVKEQHFLPTALVDYELIKEIHPSIQVVRASAKRPLQKLLSIKNLLRRKPSSIIDTSLINTISRPKDSSVVHRILRSIKNSITDLLSYPDEHIGWAPGAVLHGYKVIKNEPVDCIYATGGPWSCLLAATILHKLCGIPLLLDFRDPWVSNPNLVNKSRFFRCLNRITESFCVENANIVVANTEDLKIDFQRRYNHLDNNIFVTVTNGFECIPRNEICSNSRFTLVHAGALYLSRNPGNFLIAVADLVKNGLIPADKLRVQLVGGLSMVDKSVELEVHSMLSNNILEVIPRVSHDEALKIQEKADALLLVQTGFPLQVPRKLYEYLSLGRPVLCIAEHQSATAKMVNDLNIGYVVEDNVCSIMGGILAVYESWKSGETLSVNDETMNKYSNEYLSGRLRYILSNVIN